jgi:hypothetical protein
MSEPRFFLPAFPLVPQNAFHIELCLPLTNGKPRVAGQAGPSYGTCRATRGARRHGIERVRVAARQKMEHGGQARNGPEETLRGKRFA